MACAGPLDPLLAPKSSLCEEKMAAWEAAAGQGPAPLFMQTAMTHNYAQSCPIRYRKSAKIRSLVSLGLEGGQFCPQPAFSRLWPPKRRLRPRLAALQFQTDPLLATQSAAPRHQFVCHIAQSCPIQLLKSAEIQSRARANYN